MTSFLQRQSIWDGVVFTLLTAFAIYNGQTTIFYVIYFFWWNELVRIVIDYFFHTNDTSRIELEDENTAVGGAFFIMGIYFVFIVVLFAFMANWGNNDAMMVNFSILLFKNWFFNLNLVYVVVQRILLHKSDQSVSVNFGAFSGSMIVMHISIILGAFLMMGVVKNYPVFFTPDNLLGSVVIISPFLLLRLGWYYMISKKNES